TSVNEVPERPKVSEFSCHLPGCCQLFDTLEGYEHHYNALHRNACACCKRSFPSAHLLDIHVLEWHDSLFQVLAEKHNMYKCLVEGCAEKFKSSQDRKEHLVSTHLYPADFRFDKPKKTKSVEASEQHRGDSMETGPGEAMEVPVPNPLPEKRFYKSRFVPCTLTGKNCHQQVSPRCLESIFMCEGTEAGELRDNLNSEEKLPAGLLPHKIKVFSSEEQAWRGKRVGAATPAPWPALGPQPMLGLLSSAAGPEEDLDHLHHPEDNVVEEVAHVRLLALPRQVQNGPEEDRDHIYHGRDEEM
uniref:Zinc finger protein 511 n=1 Tax=Nothoprocta perdicaria TaxID=30464 RepID=A0A8C6ZCZ0_NOTPE